jgi:hypothetical protein
MLFKYVRTKSRGSRFSARLDFLKQTYQLIAQLVPIEVSLGKRTRVAPHQFKVDLPISHVDQRICKRSRMRATHPG